jgi:hypothetical protein
MQMHKNANIRTSLDFPDPLFRALKVDAASRGVSLREHVIGLIERGMRVGSTGARDAAVEAAAYQVPAIPSICGQRPSKQAIKAFTNAELSAILDDEEAARAVRVMARSHTVSA